MDEKLKTVTSNKNELNELLKKVKATSTTGLTKHFSLEIFQNYLGFIPAKKYMKYFSGTTRIESWKSNEMSEENIENIPKSNSNFAPTVADHHVLPGINLKGPCLIKNNISIPKKVLNLYIS